MRVFAVVVVFKFFIVFLCPVKLVGDRRPERENLRRKKAGKGDLLILTAPVRHP